MTVTIPVAALVAFSVGGALIVAAATSLLARARWPKWAVHNLVAHPLLVICPPLGGRLHDATAPAGDD